MIAAGTAISDARDHGTEYEEYVTVSVGDQILGLPIDRVHDVFVANILTSVPLAPREIVGLLNLRGRVVTAMCLRRRLGLEDRKDTDREMAIGLEHESETFGLLVDAVGEVVKLSPEKCEPNPVHMDDHWSKLTRGVCRLDDKLLTILDVDAVLSLGVNASRLHQDAFLARM